MFKKKKTILAIMLTLVLLCSVTVGAWWKFGENNDEKKEEKQAITKASNGKYNESPMLAKKVAKGELPPVDERLPEEPFVVGPGTLIDEKWLDWQPGQYGGTLKVAGVPAANELMLAFGITTLRGTGQSTENPAPAIFSDYTASDDYKTFKFTIRKGLKWSDGVPVTTEDVRFTLENIYLDKRVNEVLPPILKTQGTGTPVKLEIVDDYTFIAKFDKPYGWFISQLASWIEDYTKILQPSHYLKKFHADYTPVEEIQPFVEEEGLNNWAELLALKTINHWEMTSPIAIGVPVLTPWVPVKIDANTLEYERNPYYWKVDAEGNQLPYIDRISNAVVNEQETLTMRAISGNVDLLTQHATLTNMPLYRENEARGNYKTLMTGSINNPQVITLNQDYDYQNKDSVWQQLMRDPQKRFAKALALAMDSEDINENLYFGMYDMPTVTTAEYNPTKAKALLDEIGMDKFDEEGYRLGPDGKRFEFVFSVSDETPDIIPMAELLKEYYQAVGIRTTIEQMGLKIWFQRKDNNQIMASIHWNDGPIWSSGISSDYMPNYKGPWAPASQFYYDQDGRTGRKPPKYLQEFFDIHTARKQYPAQSKEGKKLYQDLMNWFSENYVMIYPLENVKKPNIISNRLGNIPKEGYPYGLDIAYSLEQIFIKQK